MSIVSLGLLLATNLTFAKPVIGEAAPDFELVDTNGNNVALSSLKGKTVVMEWTNHQCPYVRKHYNSNNMQSLQKQVVSDDVVWITVNSSAQGKQGYLNAEQANELILEEGALPTHYLLDPSGDLGKSYAAKTTPHMYIINAEGTLSYMGGIDDTPTADRADIAGAKNYVRAAFKEIRDGKEVSSPSTRPYGCSVKYKS